MIIILKYYFLIKLLFFLKNSIFMFDFSSYGDRLFTKINKSVHETKFTKFI